ncbi:MAG: translation elongation factor Ts [Gammaproteobacteria bacterium]|nr:translation elongation factor Ts [Gammaproteobacteria bacterium]MCY4274456.1 translation elongation factor Ts [Gammaproteobacteria bacterium]
MTISAAMIKELRQLTGAGMMDCKRALEETGGDMEQAIAELRKKGAAAAAKRAGRIAAEGVITCQSNTDYSVLVEVNCETDFVAKDDSFVAFCNQVAETILEQRPTQDMDLGALDIAGGPTDAGFTTIEEARQGLITKVGENISVRRFTLLESSGGVIGHYLHGSKIGVIVALSQASNQLKLDIAMHIAASAPLFVDVDDVDQRMLENERKIFQAQAEETGKPADTIEKIVKGKVAKFLSTNALLEQPFVKDPDTKVRKHLESEGAQVRAMVRFEVGEGLEKRNDDFVAEVMSQVQG